MGDPCAMQSNIGRPIPPSEQHFRHNGTTLPGSAGGPSAIPGVVSFQQYGRSREQGPGVAQSATWVGERCLARGMGHPSPSLSNTWPLDLMGRERDGLGAASVPRCLAPQASTPAGIPRFRQSSAPPPRWPTTSLPPSSARCLAPHPGPTTRPTTSLPPTSAKCLAPPPRPTTPPTTSLPPSSARCLAPTRERAVPGTPPANARCLAPHPRTSPTLRGAWHPARDRHPADVCAVPGTPPGTDDAADDLAPADLRAVPGTTSATDDPADDLAPAELCEVPGTHPRTRGAWHPTRERAVPGTPPANARCLAPPPLAPPTRRRPRSRRAHATVPGTPPANARCLAPHPRPRRVDSAGLAAGQVDCMRLRSGRT